MAGSISTCAFEKDTSCPGRTRTPNDTVEAFVSDRIEYLEKTAHLHRIELFWCLTIEPVAGAGHSGRRRNSTRGSTARVISQLRKTAELLTSQSSDLLGMRLLGKADVVSFFSYLLNLEEWSLDRRLASDQEIDRQIVGSSVEWHPIICGSASATFRCSACSTVRRARGPNLFGCLQAIDANMIACATWVPIPRATVQKRIAQIEGFSGSSATSSCPSPPT